MSAIDDKIIRRLIGMQEMLIAAGAEMSRLNDAQFTPLGQQAGGWRAEITRMVGEIDYHIMARAAAAEADQSGLDEFHPDTTRNP